MAAATGGGKPSLYQQVKRELLAAGEYAPGRPFVTQREICERFNVSHASAVRALNDLADEGYVVRRRGQGTFVVDRPPAETRRALLRELLQGGQPPTMLLCSNGYALATVAQDLVALGLEAPCDIDLACMDDAGPFGVLPPTAAAIALPAREMGRQAMALLHERVTGTATATQLLTLPVTVRLK